MKSKKEVDSSRKIMEILKSYWFQTTVDSEMLKNFIDNLIYNRREFQNEFGQTLRKILEMEKVDYLEKIELMKIQDELLKGSQQKSSPIQKKTNFNLLFFILTPGIALTIFILSV